jgi:hypothetical protein
MTDDVRRHPAEVQTDAVTVDGVRVAFTHHKSFNTATERGYRLRREDTGAERMAYHAMTGVRPAVERQRLAEAFVRRSEDA